MPSSELPVCWPFKAGEQTLAEVFQCNWRPVARVWRLSARHAPNAVGRFRHALHQQPPRPARVRRCVRSRGGQPTMTSGLEHTSDGPSAETNRGRYVDTNGPNRAVSSAADAPAARNLRRAN